MSAHAEPIRAPRSRRSRRLIRNTALYAALTALAAVMLMPTYWMFVTAVTKTGKEYGYPPKLWPDEVVWRNFWDALTLHPFDIYYKNSIVIAVLATAGALVTESLVGYGFARLRFPGRDVLFAVCLATLMLPFVVTMIPRFVIFRELHMIDTIWPLVVPYFFGGSPFGVFLFRQYYRSIPYEYDEAAQVDGAGFLRIWRSVIVPQSWAMFAALGILHFVFFWNDFIGPLIFLTGEENQTLTLGILNYRGQYTQQWNYMMAAALTMIIPVIVVVLLGQRFFRRGLAISGFGGR
jgi:multiple sugar transport system permease protein